jgi:hypothetical protein
MGLKILSSIALFLAMEQINPTQTTKTIASRSNRFCIPAKYHL